jgi:hypothetical protein
MPVAVHLEKVGKKGAVAVKKPAAGTGSAAKPPGTKPPGKGSGKVDNSDAPVDVTF